MDATRHLRGAGGGIAMTTALRTVATLALTVVGMLALTLVIVWAIRISIFAESLADLWLLKPDSRLSGVKAHLSGSETSR
jgi:hypothetical protein